MEQDQTTDTTQKPTLLSAAHCSALAELYRSRGVGDTTEHKLSFWKSQHPSGYSISHNPTPEAEIAVMEMSWLCDQFPNDFEMC